VNVRGFTYPFRTDGPLYQTIEIKCKRGTNIQIHESPTGRSVQIHVLHNGEWRKVFP
jgi:hypothetical protein